MAKARQPREIALENSAPCEVIQYLEKEEEAKRQQRRGGKRARMCQRETSWEATMKRMS